MDFSGKTHIVIAVGLTALFIAPVNLLFIAFGSVLPDVDSRRSMLGRYNPLRFFMTHRGHCHSLLGSALLCAPVYLLGGSTAFLFVLAGAVIHLLSDKLYSWFPGRKPFPLKLW